MIASWALRQEALIAAKTAEEEHEAELAQGPEAAIGDDPLAAMEGETHGTDADAGDYLLQSDEAPVDDTAIDDVTAEEITADDTATEQ